MGIGGIFRELGDFLDECERRGGEVGDVRVTDGTRTNLTAEVEVAVTLSACPADGDTETMTASRASVEPDGTVSVTLESAERLVPTSDYDVAVELVDATVDSDGGVLVTLSVTAPSARDSHANTTTTGRSSNPEPTGRAAVAAATSDVPPFRNPDLLAEVYESCDTFAEMADSLEMDVTAETVRRYMIDHDIHQPNSYRTDGVESDDSGGEEEPDARQPIVLSDGIGLPDDVTVDTLIETVSESSTIYEVKQDIGIDREDALDMLQDLNLLDLVVGRLATEAERDISRDDIVERLREASATQ